LILVNFCLVPSQHTRAGDEKTQPVH